MRRRVERALCAGKTEAAADAYHLGGSEEAWRDRRAALPRSIERFYAPSEPCESRLTKGTGAVHKGDRGTEVATGNNDAGASEYASPDPNSARANVVTVSRRREERGRVMTEGQKRRYRRRALLSLGEFEDCVFGGPRGKRRLSSGARRGVVTRRRDGGVWTSCRGFSCETRTRAGAKVVLVIKPAGSRSDAGARMVRGTASTQARARRSQHRGFRNLLVLSVEWRPRRSDLEGVHDVVAGCFWCTFEKRRIREPGSKIYGLEASRFWGQDPEAPVALWYVSIEQRAVLPRPGKPVQVGATGPRTVCVGGCQGAGLIDNEGLVGGSMAGGAPRCGARHAIRPGLREGASGRWARTRRHQCQWREGGGEGRRGVLVGPVSHCGVMRPANLSIRLPPRSGPEAAVFQIWKEGPR